MASLATVSEFLLSWCTFYIFFLFFFIIAHFIADYESWLWCYYLLENGRFVLIRLLYICMLLSSFYPAHFLVELKTHSQISCFCAFFPVYVIL
ncbi:hypothetical protein MIMGU_mgv1a022055mg [Erythranthe guttata]|uniref:Uncharacterized protein n=1 Tax=Erythranthe guttata TaxID=4155 RepID=A0A022S2V2_ERYGU|nr:hypothetical protein MIMGU_mgv1a022055mg [Erythranthe guttata]